MQNDKFSEEYNKLNANQSQAVDSVEDGPVMVIAGAGTGKTKVIAMRIANILKQTDMNAENILCMTFTDAGVTAMLESLIKIIGPDAYRVKICTFHSFCNEVISSHPEEFPQVNKDGEALSEIEQVKLILKLINELPINSYIKPYSKPDMYLRDIISKLSKIKKEYIHPEEYLRLVLNNEKFYLEFSRILHDLRKKHYTKFLETDVKCLISDFDQKGFNENPYVKFIKMKYEKYSTESVDGDEKETKKLLRNLRMQIFENFDKNFKKGLLERQKGFAEIFKRYQEELAKFQKYDYEDMIIYTVDAFKSNPDLLSEYQERYQYILVDEYQDTNASQNEAIFLLGSFFPNPNIFVVGDDDQSIYRFQGANTQNIFSFKEKFSENIKIITLVDNYRSHQLILDAAASVIKHNESRLVKLMDGISKDLIARPDKESKPLDVFEFMTLEQEAYELVKKVKDLLNKNVNVNDIAVLCRNNADIEYMYDMFRKAGIPASRDEGEDIFTSTNIRQFIYLLKALIYPDDDENFFLLLASNFLALPSFDLIKLNTYSKKIRKTISEVLLDLDSDYEGINLSQKDKFIDFAKKYLDWRVKIYNTNAVIFFNELLNESGLLSFIKAQKNFITEICKVNRLYKEIKNLSEKSLEYTLQNFVDDIEIYKKYNIRIIDKESNWITDKVKLSTVHKSKGLEYDYVFLFDCVNKKWSNSSKGDKLKPPVGIFNIEMDSGENEEERRLFYVAITRAKKHVSILYSTASDTGKTARQPAQFIKEIDEKFISFVKNDSSESVSEAQEFILSHTLVINFRQDSRDYVLELVSKLQLAVTHVNSYLACPRCFFYKTLLRIPHIKSSSQVFGTVIHEALKYTQNYFNENALLPTEKGIKSTIERSLISEFVTKEAADSILEKSLQVMKQFLQEKPEAFTKGSITEKNMSAYKINWSGIPIGGKIDLIKFVEDKNHVEVIDYKTGNADSTGRSVDYKRQLLFYKLLIENTPQLKWHISKGSIVYVEPSKSDDAKWIEKSYELSGQDYLELQDTVKDVYQKINDLKFDECGPKCDNYKLHDLILSF